MEELYNTKTGDTVYASSRAEALSMMNDNPYLRWGFQYCKTFEDADRLRDKNFGDNSIDRLNHRFTYDSNTILREGDDDYYTRQYKDCYSSCDYDDDNDYYIDLY